ncbi:hypothetical protein Tco_1010624 [Tanacetum coccineum]
MYYPRFTKVIIHYFLTKDKTVSRRNKICMHTSRDDHLINTLRFVSANEESQIYEARLPESMTRVTPPKKARKFKMRASPKLKTVLASPNEPTKKSKRVKRPAKKSPNTPTTGVVIKDTPGVSVSKKIAPAKADRGKGIELLSDAALIEETQLKKTLKKSKQETHKLQASGLSEGADFESEVPDESKAKSSDASEGTGVKLGVPNVYKADSSESDNESWGDSEDDNESDDNNDEDSENDDDDGNDAQDSERTDLDEDENPNLNLNVDEEEETQEEEYVHTTNYSVPTDEETDNENKEFDDEEYDDLYKDVNVRSKVAEHEEVGKGDVEMTDATRESGSQEKSYELVSRAKVIENQVMAISIISVSSDSSKESMGTSTGRVILFGTIPTTIPDTTPSVIPPTTHIDTTPIPTVSPTILPSPDYTPVSPDYSPASDTDDIPDTPPSPTYGTPFTETTLSTQRSPVASGALRRRVMVLAPGQPIPHGRPYRYHLNGPVHMMTARKRVGPLPTHRLAVRHSVDYSSSDHFSSDDSSRDSSSSSSSRTSSNSSTDALSDSTSSRLSSDHSLPTPSSGMRSSHYLCSLVPSIHRSSAAISERSSHDSSSASPSRKRSRSPAASLSLSSPTLGALSYARVDLLPSPKRIRSPETATDLEGCSKDSFEPYLPREAGLGVDFEDESSEPSRSRGTNLEEDIKVVRSDGIDFDLEIQANIDDSDDIQEPAQEGAVVCHGMRHLGDLVQSFIDHTRDSIHSFQSIENVQRDQVHRIVATRQHSIDMLKRIRELELDNMRLRDMMDVASQRVARAMPNTRFGLAGALGARNAAKNLKPLMRDGGEQEEVNGGNGNRGNGNGGNGNGGNGNGGNRNRENGNGNGNGGGNGYNFGGFVPARECTYQDFLKCQPLSFNGMEGVVGLNRWVQKMETVFHISNCPEKYQVKYATCTLLNSALTWWNSHKRIIEIKAAYAMKDRDRVVKGNDLTAYTRRFQELRNIIAAEPTKLQDAIRIANNLMDQKLKGYARSAENKRRLENNPRDTRGQQPVFKRQNVRGQNVARAYTAGNNEKNGPGHFKKDYPKLRNQYRGNQTGNKNRNKTGNQTRGNEATTKAYAIGGGGANPDSNVDTGTFLLNYCYASMLFDSGADRSFVSSTFSALLDVALSTLDTSYAVELADGRISETNVVLRGCTLGLLGHPFDINLIPVELGSFDVIIVNAEHHIVYEDPEVFTEGMSSLSSTSYIPGDLGQVKGEAA